MKLYLDSSKSTNNRFTLDNTINGRWELISFVCTNNLFNVNEYNNKVYFNENGTDRIATLTVGSYYITDLKTELANAMNNVGSANYSVSIDTSTNKYTITNSGSVNFYFTFGSNKTNSARRLLGMNETDGTNGITQSSDIPADLNTHKNIFININENNDRDVNGQSFFNTSFIINGVGSFGEIMRYVKTDNFSQYVKLRNTKHIEVKIHDIDNNSIDLNSNYVLILEKVS